MIETITRILNIATRRQRQRQQPVSPVLLKAVERMSMREIQQFENWTFDTGRPLNIDSLHAWQAATTRWTPPPPRVLASVGHRAFA